MDIIYLDYNCFQRSFDDTSQIKIQMEALAKKCSTAQSATEFD